MRLVAFEPMTTYIALLRGINVGGHNKVPMAALRELLTELGFAEPRTLLQSGNAVFRAPAQGTAALEARLEAAAAERLGVTCDFVVRTADQWRQMIATNPMPNQAERDPGHFVVTCLKTAPPAEAVGALRAAITGPETIQAAGPDLFVHYPADIGNSKLTNTVIERRLGIRGAARNWNTVLKLAALI